MTYFTSDQHFGHFSIIRLSHRPFASADEMDKTMIAKWNAKVKVGDTIYVLGDLFFRFANVEPILNRLNVKLAGTVPGSSRIGREWVFDAVHTISPL